MSNIETHKKTLRATKWLQDNTHEGLSMSTHKEPKYKVGDRVIGIGWAEGEAEVIRKNCYTTEDGYYFEYEVKGLNGVRAMVAEEELGSIEPTPPSQIEEEGLESMAKRLYVAKAEQRLIDCNVYGPNCYGPTSLEECRIELGLQPINNTK